MLIELSKIVNSPVGALDQGKKVGTVKRVIINPDEGKVIALAIQTGLLREMKVASFIDVVEIDNNGVVISSPEQLLDLDDIIRVKELLRVRFDILGLKVVDQRGKFLGFVSDAVIDSQTGNLCRIYVGFLWRNYIFIKKQIINIELNKITVDVEQGNKEKAIKIAKAEA